jgi:[protein]-arginine 3-hydroxylase / protease
MSETTQKIERVHQPSPLEFYQRFVKANRPAVLTGLTHGWAAIKKWSPDYFRANYPNAKVAYTAWERSDSGDDPTAYYRSRKRRTTTLGQFIESMNQSPSTRDYISQFPILNELPQLADDFQSLDAYMNIPELYPAKLRRKLRKAATLWLGPQGIVTPVHFDSAHNLLVQIRGHKKLVLIPPQQSKLLYYPRLELGHVNFSPVDVEAPDFERFPRFRHATPLELELAPGEVLFIPVRWWHYARALEQTISINFWWFSMDSLRRMWHPYLVYKMSRLFR